MQPSHTPEERDSGPVTHPTPEEWVSYLYGEEHGATRTRLKAHLRACATCRSTVAAWQRTHTQLGRWRLPRPVQPAPLDLGWPVLKWAVALLVFGLGCWIGRFSSPRMDAAAQAGFEQRVANSVRTQLRQDLEKDWQADWRAVLSRRSEALNTPARQQLRAALDQVVAQSIAAAQTNQQAQLAEFLENYRGQRDLDQRQLTALLAQAERQRRADYVALRRNLETVAVVAADRLQRTESQIGQLASYTEAAQNPSAP